VKPRTRQVIWINPLWLAFNSPGLDHCYKQILSPCFSQTMICAVAKIAELSRRQTEMRHCSIAFVSFIHRSTIVASHYYKHSTDSCRSVWFYLCLRSSLRGRPAKSIGVCQQQAAAWQEDQGQTQRAGHCRASTAVAFLATFSRRHSATASSPLPSGTTPSTLTTAATGAVDGCCALLSCT